MDNLANQPIPGTTTSAKHHSVVYRQPAHLTIDDRNARHHPEEQIEQLMSSMRTFGFNGVVLIDTADKIISGNALVMAALELGLDVIPTFRIDHLSPAKIKAFKIANNRLAEKATWNKRMLAELFLELREEELDFSEEETGFSTDEIDELIEDLDDDQEGKPDPDDQAPALVEGTAVSELGDRWLLDDNVVFNGDATEKDAFDKLMDGKRAAMCFTDPPYNVNYGHSAKDKMRDVHRPILNDNLGDDFGAFLLASCANILSVTEGAIYICMSSSELHVLQKAFAEARGHWSTFIIWAKQTFTLGRADYQRQYEPILYGWREGAERFWCGARDQGDVWFINKPFKNDLHPSMKPIELMIRAMRNSSQRGDIVLDPFLGSGSTLISAERTGRICYGIELDPRYVDTIIRRWQQHTGGQAVHAVSGKAFDTIAAEKGAMNVKQP